MWALRRVSDPLRKVGCTLEISRACCMKIEMPKSLEGQTDLLKSSHAVSGNCLSSKKFYHSKDVSSRNFVGSRGLSFQAGAESSGEENNPDNGFSDLEMPARAEATKEGNADNELSSESELSSDDDDDAIEDPYLNEVELSDHETNASNEKSSGKENHSELLRAILANLRVPVHNVLDKWVAEGKELGQKDISLVLLNLRKRRMYRKALQVYVWVEAKKLFDLLERDYISHLDLIAKVYGLQKAEDYIQNIPESFRGEVVYRTLLANCVGANNIRKAEEVFNKMKDLGFPRTPFACNQLLILYKKLDRKKIADVLLLMENENVKPDDRTYGLLIDIKGQYNDITGMDQIVETMKSEGIEPDIRIQTILCEHYIRLGMKEKAETIMKQMEGANLQETRIACQALLPLYAALGKADEIKRVWKVCESNPWPRECIAAMKAWGKLKRIEEAEAIFNKMSKLSNNRPSATKYVALLEVYADNKMLDKGKDLVKQMAIDGYRIDPFTWDALMKLYVNAGEVEKADSVLRKAAEKGARKPLYTSYTMLMDEYANRGDVHNAEKILHSMKQVGYIVRMKQFLTLVRAYKNAKAPAYGIRDRMRAYNIIPNKSVDLQIAHVEPFRKTAASDLLD